MRNDRLSKAISENGLSQSEFALKLGFSKQAVSNWVTGYSNPPLVTALKISDLLGKDVAFLFSQKVQDSHTNKEVI